MPNNGFFQFTRLTFGIQNAPSTFQHLIDTVLSSEVNEFVFCYFDDVIVVTHNFDTPIEILQELLSPQDAAGTLNRKIVIFK